MFTGEERFIAPNAVLVSGRNDSVLIDCGFVKGDVEKLLSLVKGCGKRLRAIFITHCARASSAGEFHSRARSEPDENLSSHTAPAPAVTPRVVTSCGLAALIGSSHCWLMRRVQLHNITPSLCPCPADFIATTGRRN